MPTVIEPTKKKVEKSSAQEWVEEVNAEAERKLGRKSAKPRTISMFRRKGELLPFVRRANGKWQYLNQTEAVKRRRRDCLKKRTIEILEGADVDLSEWDNPDD